MAVVIKCDLCDKVQEILPGEHSMYTGSAANWVWIKPASFDMSFQIAKEVICNECQRKITAAQTDAGIKARNEIINAKPARI